MSSPPRQVAESLKASLEIIKLNIFFVAFRVELVSLQMCQVATLWHINHYRILPDVLAKRISESNISLGLSAKSLLSSRAQDLVGKLLADEP